MIYKLFITTISSVFHGSGGSATSVSTQVLEFPSEDEADLAATILTNSKFPTMTSTRQVIKLY